MGPLSCDRYIRIGYTSRTNGTVAEVCLELFCMRNRGGAPRYGRCSRAAMMSATRSCWFRVWVARQAWTKRVKWMGLVFLVEHMSVYISLFFRVFALSPPSEAKKMGKRAFLFGTNTMINAHR